MILPGILSIMPLLHLVIILDRSSGVCPQAYVGSVYVAIFLFNANYWPSEFWFFTTRLRPSSSIDRL
jgi:hypothetical protein